MAGDVFLFVLDFSFYGKLIKLTNELTKDFSRLRIFLGDSLRFGGYLYITKAPNKFQGKLSPPDRTIKVSCMAIRDPRTTIAAALLSESWLASSSSTFMKNPR